MPTIPAALAVDAGGSTTRALVVTRDGSCGPIARSGRGNPVSDPARAASHIAEACLRATAESPHRPQMIMAAVAGTVSRDFPELSTELRSHDLPDTITIVSDLLAAYFSATPAMDGHVLIVGTGAVAARVVDGELAAIRDGLGWLLGDDGSGFWIGHKVARAVAAELDGRGPATSLTPRVLDQLKNGPRRARVRTDELTDIPRREGVRPDGLTDAPYGASEHAAELTDTPPREGVRSEKLAMLLSWSQSRAPVELSALAILAAEEADTDSVASAICEQAADHALATLFSLGATTREGSDKDPVVLGGSVLNPVGPVGQCVHAALEHRALPVSDGVAGAALLAVRALGGTADATMLAHISRQLLAV